MQRILPGPTKSLYFIGEASKLLGISIDTLRRWDSLGKISLIRTPGGTRLVPLSEIERIKSGGKPSEPIEIKAVSAPPQPLTQIPTLPRKLYQKIIHNIRFTRPVWYQRWHAHPVSRPTHLAILGFALIIASSLFAYYWFIAPLSKESDRKIADLGKVLPATEPPRILSFQGRLTDENGVPETGATNMRFRIWDQLSAGTEGDCSGFDDDCLWRSAVRSVDPDQNGIFSVTLGDTGAGDPAIPTTLFSDYAELYLGVTAGGDSEMTPRQRIASVSYALNSDSLDGIDSLSFLRSDTSDTFSGGTLTLTFAGTQNLATTSDLAGNVNVLSLIGTPSGSAGTAQGLFIQQADSSNSNGLDAAMVINNADTNLAITDAILISNSGGGAFGDYIDAPNFDVSNAGTVTIAASQSYTGAGAVTLSSGNDTNLTLNAAGTGTLWFSGYDCSALSNGGTLTALNTGEIACQADDGGGGGGALHQITAATGAGSAQDSNANSIFWNWDFTSAGTDSGLTISESSASTNGLQNEQALLEITTLATSTASPLQITSNSADVGDIWINLASDGDFEIQDASTAFATFADDGSISLGKATAASTINIGTGTGADTINIGTGGGGDNITIGTLDDSGLDLYLAGNDIQITGSGVSPYVWITTSAANDAGSIEISPGNSTAFGTGGGNVFLIGGDVSGTGTPYGGRVDIKGGNATEATGYGGDVRINPGTGPTGNGDINIGSITAGNINIGRAAGAKTITIGETGANGNTIALGTGTGADIINIGTGATNADTVTVGNINIPTTLTFNTGTSTGTDPTLNNFAINLQANGTGSSNTLQGLVITQNDTATTGVYDSLLKITNLKTPEPTTNGLFIEQNAASGTLSNAIQITNTAGTLATGINFTGTFGNYIVAPNFSVSNAGAVSAVGVNSGSGLIQGTGGITVTGALTVTSTSATATTIGANGATNPAFLIDASTASSATGLKVTSAAAAGGVALAGISSGTNENLTLSAKGSGTITLASGSTGNVGFFNVANNYITSAGNLTLAGTTISATSATQLNLGAATIDFNGAGIIQMNNGSDFTIQDDGPNNIFKITGSSHLIEFGNTTDNNAFTFLGTGTTTFTGLLTAARVPAGTGVSQGSLYINPASATADYTLLGLAVNGTEKLRVDEDGDIDSIGHLAIGATASISTDEILSVKETFSTGTPIGIRVNPTLNTDISYAFGMQVDPIKNDATATNGFYGIKVLPTISGSGQVSSSLIGIQTSWSIGGSTVGSGGLGYGMLVAAPTASKLNVVSTAYGINIGNQGNTNIGTASYGLYVADQTTAGGPNEYGIAIAGADTYALWVGSGGDYADAANGITFGQTVGTSANLYRSADNTLKTDGNLYIAKHAAIGSTTSGPQDTQVLRVMDTITVSCGAGSICAGIMNIAQTQTASSYNYGIYSKAGAITGAATAVYDFYAQNPMASSGGSFVSAYGMYINSITTGSSTNVGLYIADAGNYSLQLGGNGFSASSGITFGSDGSEANLYRSAAHTLTTNDNLIVAKHMALGSSGTLGNNGLALQENTTIKGTHGIDVIWNYSGSESTAGVYGIYNTTQYTGTAGSGAYTTGIYSATYQNSTAINVASLRGINSALFSGASSVNFDEAIGIIISAPTWSGGKPLDTYGILINDQGNGNNRASANAYGIYINNQTTAATAIGLYIADAGNYSLQLASNDYDAAQGITFGSDGSEANLYRSAAHTLTTNDNLIVAKHMALGSSAGISLNHTLKISDTLTGSCQSSYCAGIMNLAQTQTASSINYGIYSQAGVATGAALGAYDFYAENPTMSNGGTVTNAFGMYINSITAGGTKNVGLAIVDAGTYSLQLASTDGDAASGITFGTDTNLYRSAPDTLKTGDSFVLGSFSANPTGENGMMYYNTTSGLFRCYQAGAWADCLQGGASSTALSALTNAAATRNLSNANWAQTWGWGTLTTETGMAWTGGSAMTTGSLFSLGSSTYVHGAAQTGSLMSLAFSDTTSGAFATTTNGLLISPTMNTTGSSARTFNGESIQPALTACGTTNGTCTYNSWETDLPALTQATTNTFNFRGLNLASAGALQQNTAAGTINWAGANIIMPNINSNFAAGTIDASGLNITVGTTTTAASAITQNDGIEIILPSGTDSIVTGGTVNGIDIPIVAIGPNVGIVNGINIGGYTTTTSGGTINAININSITTSGGADTAIKIGSLWDYEIQFADTSPTMLLADASTYAWYDGTNTLLSIVDQGTYATLRLKDKGSTGDPGTCTAGDIYFNDTDNTFKGCTSGNTWEQLDNGAESQQAITVDPSPEAVTNIGSGETEVAQVDITPTTATGDVYIEARFEVTSSSSADQTLLVRVEDNNNCTGNTIGTQMSFTITANAGVLTGNYLYTGIDVDAGASAQSYTLCMSTAAGDTDIDDYTLSALVIDTGSDIAELYTTNDTGLEAGHIVRMDTNLESGVKKTEKAYDSQVFGVISTRPGSLFGGVKNEGIKAVPLALVGRVPVKVNGENGPIEVGDLITSSSTPGIGMKATKAGYIIGRAMTAFSCPNSSTSEEFETTSEVLHSDSSDGESLCQGAVLAFVNTHYANPADLTDDSNLLNLDNIDATASAKVATASSLKLNAENNIVATLSAGTRFVWTNSVGRVVAWVSDAGEAVFEKVTALVGDFRKLIFGELVASKDSKVAGEASFEMGATEVFIESNKITRDSLINLTPTSKTKGLSLYIKEKRPGEGFVVALERSIGDQLTDATASASRPITFTWFILNQE